MLEGARSNADSMVHELEQLTKNSTGLANLSMEQLLQLKEQMLEQ